MALPVPCRCANSARRGTLLTSVRSYDLDSTTNGQTAAPATASRSVATALPTPSQPRTAPARSTGADRRGTVSAGVWIALGLLVLGLLSRDYTTNSLAGEPTTDEYLYAVHARDIARGWAAGQFSSGAELADEGRSVAVETAALSFVVPLDVLTLGRTIQALLNALCIPMTFVLARQVGLSRAAGVASALLLLAAPEFQESAWRFWTDSQATLLTLLYLTALLAWCRRPSWVSGVGAIACALLLLVTKESAAVALAPLLVVVAIVGLVRQVDRWWALPLAAAVLAVCAIGGAAVLIHGIPAELEQQPLLQRTFASAPLVVSSIRAAVPQLPSYPTVLADQIGEAQVSIAFIVAAALGYVTLVAGLILAIVRLVRGDRRRASVGWMLGLLVAVLLWLPGAAMLVRDLQVLGRVEAWLGLAAGSVVVAFGSIALERTGVRTPGWSLALLGLVVVVFFGERLVISVTPEVANAALFFRSFMPTIPLFAILGGAGLFAAAGVLGWPARGRAAALEPWVVVGVACLLVAVWSPLLRERTTSTALLGRVADRDADPESPQGLRVEALVEAQPWLLQNLQPSDVTITSLPRQLAWYADLGVDGMDRLLDLGAHPSWTAADRRDYIEPRFGPRGAAYVIDFNVNWTDPGSDAAREWQQTYQWLISQPHLEVAYLKRDRFGNPVFYVIRNDGYAK